MKLHAMLCWLGAFAILGAVTAAQTEGTPPAANIRGASNGGAKPATPPAGTAQKSGQPGKGKEPATAAADTVAPAPADVASVATLAPPAHLIGDASLRGSLNFATKTLADGHYVVDLGDDRRAVLTLDPALQEAAEAVLARAKAPMGAVVVMSKEGRILALAGRQAQKSTPELATRVWAPAASIFKIVTAAALVKAGVRPTSKVCYHDGFRSVEASNLQDLPERDTRCDDLTFGMARSQNAVIAKLVHRHLDPRALRATARAFGFGATPEFALPADPGRADIPDSKLDFARVSAGFWQTELSPLGGALVAGTIASGGMRLTPRLVDTIVAGNAVIPVMPPPAERALTPEIARALAQMMTATTESGTAYKGFHDEKGRKFLPNTPVAGKTGTLTRRSPSYLEYSWFVGFAPRDKPEIIVSVLLGNPERWHIKAHTAARLIMEKAF